jgi:hypothetical protein
MSAGLPVTGLGGAFYLLLILWMVPRELLKQHPTAPLESRWRFIGKMTLIALFMVAVFICQGLLIHSAVQYVVSRLPSLAHSMTIPSQSLLIIMAGLPFIVIGLLLSGVHLLRLTLGREALRLSEKH